eukprot:TRINITY_DN6366_c0_g2_i1.p1 TRINITY_DN6366_c0_g2~~TRINITY_DN6366_c0_g2_i1.p1  ORF type:complete len:740 (+),score=252.70 TRINITY_DN6366_c0_g2_i1:106-2325(+)
MVDMAISQEMVRMLSDHKADVRKKGAAEVQSKVEELRRAKNGNAVHELIRTVRARFLKQADAWELRKGGLLAVSAIAIGLGSAGITDFVAELVEAPLELFNDSDTAIKYHAAECLYNVARVARGLLLAQFGDIFGGICRLKCNTDRRVLNASDTLDVILRNIATESTAFSAESFVKTVGMHIQRTEPRIRQHVLSWLLLLDSVPEISLLQHLPRFLGGVFAMLADPDAKISGLAKKVLDTYLRRLRECAAAAPDDRLTIVSEQDVEWGDVMSMAIDACAEVATRSNALTWIIDILTLAGSRMIPYIPRILKVMLSCVADDQEAIRRKASQAVENLASLFLSTPATDEAIKAVLAGMLETLTQALRHPEEAKRCALECMLMVLDRHPELISEWNPKLFPNILSLLTSSDEVVELALEVLAMTTRDNSTEFRDFLTRLVSLLQGEGYTHMSRAGHIIRTLAKITPSGVLFSDLSDILSRVSDVGFVSSLVTNINMILLTSPELLPLRNILKRALHDPDAKALFEKLYSCWSYNPVSLLGLCLLARAYEHAYTLVQAFGEMEMTVGMLLEIDKLIQMIESPVFTYLRLALLEPEDNPYLVKTLFGILMLLPQSPAFHDLHKRLKSVNTVCSLKPMTAHVDPAPVKRKSVNDTRPRSPHSKSSVRDALPLDWHRMLSHFRQVEAQKEAYAKVGFRCVAPDDSGRRMQDSAMGAKPPLVPSAAEPKEQQDLDTLSVVRTETEDC